MMESPSKLIENCDSNESGDDGLVSDVPSEQILDQCDDLIKEAKNFNLHAKILKKLLNLRERKSGYDLYQRPKSAECNSIGSKIDKNESVDCGILLNKIDQLRKEVEESHRLGFCLAYNIQCLQKRLNGTPIDLESGAKLIQELQAKYENSKTRDAIMKYEFQEKRKLLQRLRQQLETTRDDWSRLNVRKRKPGKEEFLTEALRQNFAHKPKQMSEESGFMESNSNVGDHDSSDDNNSASGPSGLEALAIAMDSRRRKIEELEDEYYDIFHSLANRSQSSEFSSSEIYDGQMIDEVPEGLLLDDEDDDDLTDPLSEEFDEVIEDNFPDNVIDMMDNTEEIQADMSDLPWDGNQIPLIESRNNSNADQTTISIASSVNVAGQPPADPTAAIMMSSLLPGSDIETDGEFTQQDMESMAETGEPLVLCRLRRRAVEILISRLRDEKILHESRESELKQQLEVLRKENHLLRGETNSSNSSKWNMVKKKSVMLLTVITTFMFTFSFIAKMVR